VKECIKNRPDPDSEAFSPSFDRLVTGSDGVGGFVITDATDEDQCENAREKLGFEPDHDDDVEVCQRFNDYLCDDTHDMTDELAEGGTPDTNSLTPGVHYKSFTYPADSPLEELPELADFMVPDDYTQYKSGGPKRTIIANLESAESALNSTRVYLKDNREILVTRAKDKCKSLLPEVIGFIRNPLRFLCLTLAGIFGFLANVLYQASRVALKAVGVQLSSYERGRARNWQVYYSTTSMYENFQTFDDWVHDSFETINVNLAEVRGDLQSRHTQMVNDINKYSNCMANYQALSTAGRDVCEESAFDIDCQCLLGTCDPVGCPRGLVSLGTAPSDFATPLLKAVSDLKSSMLQSSKDEGALNTEFHYELPESNISERMANLESQMKANMKANMIDMKAHVDGMKAYVDGAKANVIIKGAKTNMGELEADIEGIKSDIEGMDAYVENKIKANIEDLKVNLENNIKASMEDMKAEIMSDMEAIKLMMAKLI